MSDIAIKVENLSKRYVLNHQRAAGDGLRHVLQEKLTAPLRWLGGKIRSQKSEVSPPTSDLRPPTSDPRPPTSAASPPTSEEFWALKDVSFEIKRGEVVGVIGRNGAGKSTLLKVLSRITEPTSGRITIEGRVASLLEVGTGFHPELTGRENIFLNGAILGMSRVEIKSKFNEIVAFAEIEKFLDTPVKRYSSGMYVRLAFAVAAHLEPEILIVDEVLAVGDAQFQKKCLGKMEEVSKGGRTVLFVSHNMLAIRQLCTRAILLKSGEVLADGESAKVAGEYLVVANSALSERVSKDLQKPHIVGVQFQNQDSVPVPSARAGETAFLVIRIKTKGSKRLVFGLTIFNSDEIGIFSAISSDTLEFIPVETELLSLEIPTNILNAGRYRVEGCLVDDNTAIEQNECYLQFEIHRSGAFDLAHGKPKGLLRLPGAWCFSTNESEQ
jgi:lipopolysaccharide transport system ATP-binding protein